MVGGLLPPKPPGARYAPVELVSADNPRPRNNQVIENFIDGDAVRVLLGTTLVGEGVDLPTTDALVYARGERAEVGLVQAAYRVCTAVHGKHKAVIVDFADRHHKKLLEHSQERLRIYFEEPIFSVRVLQSSAEFLTWLREWDAC
jgi:superfamily II DNA or RNA helicase